MTSKLPYILHTIDTTGPGGAETVFLDIAERMEVDGYGTMALIKGPGWVQDQLERRKIPYVVMKPYGFLSIPYYFSLLRFVRQNNIHYVQAHLLGSALTFSIIGILSGIPVVAALHGQVDVGANERFIYIKRLLMRVGLRRVVSVSGQLANYLIEKRLFHRDKVEVIHNGVDIDKYCATHDQNIKSALKLQSDSKLVGSIGNIRPAKDYKTLIRSAAIVVKKHPNTHFLIAGHSKEPLQTELNQLVQHLKLTDHIHFMGYQEDTPGFLSQLDVFALSSSSEGFSIATLEAMAAKVPVVVTRCGGPEEIIRPDIDGLMVAVKDPDKLAEAILRQLNDGKDSERTVNAFDRVSEKFSANALILNYKRMLSEQLAR